MTDREGSVTINEYAKQLLEAVGPESQVIINVPQLADSFLKESGSFNSQESGLLAYLLISSFTGELSPDQRNRLEGIVALARKEHGIVDKMVGSVSILYREARGYFAHRSYQYDFFQVPVVPDQLAMSILVLQAHAIAASIRRDLVEEGDENLEVEAFVNPKNGEPGIWMSTEGIAFDESRIK